MTELPQAASPPMPPHHTAMRSAFLVTAHHGRRLVLEQLAGIEATDTLRSLVRVMRGAGYECRILKRRRWKDVEALGKSFPVMAQQASGHWVILIGIVAGADGTTAVAVLDPTRENSGLVTMQRREFEAVWSGILVLSKPKQRLLDANQPFGLRWFLPEIMRQSRYFRDVAIATLASNLINLGTPLLFNILIDKVVPHHSYQTLLAVVLIYLVLITFDALFGFVRQQLMIFAGNKIDARLASR